MVLWPDEPKPNLKRSLTPTARILLITEHISAFPRSSKCSGPYGQYQTLTLIREGQRPARASKPFRVHTEPLGRECANPYGPIEQRGQLSFRTIG